MQYSKLAVLSAAAGTALAGYSNSTAPPTSTETEISTTVITITSCEEDKCTEVPVTTGVTTVTEVETTYTTWCPLPTTEKPTEHPTGEKPTETETEISTTVVTITSCEEDK